MKEEERTEMKGVLAEKRSIGETGEGMTDIEEDLDLGAETGGETDLCPPMLWQWKSGRGLRRQKE